VWANDQCSLAAGTHALDAVSDSGDGFALAQVNYGAWRVWIFRCHLLTLAEKHPEVDHDNVTTAGLATVALDVVVDLHSFGHDWRNLSNLCAKSKRNRSVDA
jgi:hypothetical protein